MRHAFIVDPLPSLLVDKDTTIAFMREADRRGQEVWACGAETLGVGEGGRPFATLERVTLRDGDAWYEVGPASRQPLGGFDVVWMRKDPPYDLNYFFEAHLLELVPESTLVVNSARGLREVTEKLFVLNFPELCPETLISRQIDELIEFREKLGGEMIVKPLGGCGGEGVFHLRPEDPNVRALLEMVTRHGEEYQIAQRYIPEVRQGDKRIILVEGEPVGAVMRVPQHWESRANFHAGGSAERTELTAREREICAAIGPTLVEHGILFAGIDVIGDWLTEVNVTSPTGIREINELDGVCLEALVLDAVEARVVERP
jgi:glutathione synthase